jgi:hypothetical protein
LLFAASEYERLADGGPVAQRTGMLEKAKRLRELAAR